MRLKSVLVVANIAVSTKASAMIGNDCQATRDSPLSF